MIKNEISSTFVIFGFIVSFCIISLAGKHVIDIPLYWLSNDFKKISYPFLLFD